MPVVEIPVPSWSDVPTLRKSKKFKRLADEALALTWLMKLVAARRSELSLELYDTLDGQIPHGLKSLEFNDAEIDREKLMEIVDKLIPDDDEFEIIHAGTMTAKAGGPSSKFNKKKLVSTPIPCLGCGVENFVTTDIIEACTTHGERRAGVSIKLAGESEEES